MAIVDGHIRCCDCGDTKPVADFCPSTAAKGCGRCRECGKKARRDAELRDPERFKGYRKARAARNPEASRESKRKSDAKKKAQYQAHGPSKAIIRCSSCREEKPVAMFSPLVAARGCGQCRACKRAAKDDWARRNPDKVNAAARESRARRGEATRVVRRDYYHREKKRHWGYQLKRYGIGVDDYQLMLTTQGGCCACCGASTGNSRGKRMYVDHDHVTGAIRGLICTKCNAGIGLLGDTLDGVRRAVAYLERAQQQPPMRAAPVMRINLLPGRN